MDGKKAEVNEEIDFLVTELIYFPKGKRKTTVI